MKLLIVTQKVDMNDPILGFFHRWIIEFAKHFEYVSVICLQKGEYSLPDNVKVYSLSKAQVNESGIMNYELCKKAKYTFNFYKYIWNLRKKYDTVFVHMNPEYVALGGIFWRILGKKISLWYTHRQVNIKLLVAELFVNKIFTVSKETFNLPSKKVMVVGHGIPLKMFEKPENYNRKDNKFRLISVGRITPIKNLDVLLEAANILQKEIKNLEVLFVGSPVGKGDNEYFDKLKKMTAGFGLEEIVKFIGSISNDNIKEYYWNSDISVNLSPTGGVDKAVLESMASSLPVIVSNRAFEGYLEEYKNLLMFMDRNVLDLASKIIEFENNLNKGEIIDFLLSSVREKADLVSLISKITKEIQ